MMRAGLGGKVTGWCCGGGCGSGEVQGRTLVERSKLKGDEGMEWRGGLCGVTLAAQPHHYNTIRWHHHRATC